MQVFDPSLHCSKYHTKYKDQIVIVVKNEYMLLSSIVHHSNAPGHQKTLLCSELLTWHTGYRNGARVDITSPDVHQWIKLRQQWTYCRSGHYQHSNGITNNSEMLIIHRWCNRGCFLCRCPLVNKTNINSNECFWYSHTMNSLWLPTLLMYLNYITFAG